MTKQQLIHDLTITRNELTEVKGTLSTERLMYSNLIDVLQSRLNETKREASCKFDVMVEYKDAEYLKLRQDCLGMENRIREAALRIKDLEKEIYKRDSWIENILKLATYNKCV